LVPARGGAHHELLADGSAGTPMLLVYNTCKDFIRTIPALTCDEHNVEDVDTKLEDHCYDEAALLCMSRPLSLDLVALAAEHALAERVAKEKALTSAERAAWQEKREIEQGLAGEDNEWERLFAEEGEQI
jgi:hypothetical protein